MVKNISYLLVIGSLLLISYSAFSSEYRPTIMNFDTDGVCAANAALSNVPDSISHESGHTKHVSIGLGFGNCGSELATAIGVNKHKGDMVFKFTATVSGDEHPFGGGVSWKF